MKSISLHMPSIIEGYNYDIFISYRQKDNKHDGWVTEFVNNLKGELESTFKEEISVYFDINPHDGLLETHDVDASLKDKLKCLVFIPIISRTYCDPKSFAWEHEFKAFVEESTKDQFGLKVKLPNGNVASRVLPVSIHDLDADDIKLCESVLGGVLRGIEFIYKESGIDKPLTADDDEKKNLNNTKYRIQIIKVVHALKEIITGLKSEPDLLEKGKPHLRESHSIDIKEYNKQEGISKTVINLKSKKWLLILLSVVLCLIGVFTVFKIIEINKKNNDISKLEKSIAVLPFKNDSPSDSNKYFINGVMEKVLNNLQMVKELRVLSRTDVEQYRNTTKSIPDIAKELGVNYIVEGSGQKYGSSFSLSVQLVKAKGKETHLWGKPYEQEIQETKDILRIQSEIAQAIAAELKATITPEEKQLIEKVATTNLTAYDLCLRGDEIIQKGTGTLEKAEELYKKALEHDSTYALAYTGLACVYWNKHGDDSFLSEYYFDSLLILADRALSYDNHVPDAYHWRGMYYFENGRSEQAIKEIEKAIKCDPNPAVEYSVLAGAIYLKNKNYSDYVKSLECYYKSKSYTHGIDLAGSLYAIGDAYGYNAGFPDKARRYYQEAFQLDGDTSSYFGKIAGLEIILGNNEKAFELISKNYAMDSNKLGNIGSMGYIYYIRGQYTESLKYFKKIMERIESLTPFSASSFQNIGYIYWMNGYKKEAEYWFGKQKRFSEESLRLGRAYSASGAANYDLAAVYAFLGEKKKAYENLREFAKIHICPFGMINSIKTDPFFNSIRNEPEFQKIVIEMESKYQAEHERVRKWLEERGEL
jgi:TolB-like protein